MLSDGLSVDLSKHAKTFHERRGSRLHHGSFGDVYVKDSFKISTATFAATNGQDGDSFLQTGEASMKGTEEDEAALG